MRKQYNLVLDNNERDKVMELTNIVDRFARKGD